MAKRLEGAEMERLIEAARWEDLPEAQRRFAEVVGLEAALKLCAAFGGRIMFLHSRRSRKQIGEKLGAEAAEKLAGAFPGQTQLPNIRRVCSRVRAREIRAAGAEAGACASEAAERFGVAESMVRRIWAREWGAKRRRGRPGKRGDGTEKRRVLARLEERGERLRSAAFRALLKDVKLEDLEGKQRDFAEAVGLEGALKLCEVLGGMGGFTVPSGLEGAREKRNEEICRMSAAGAAVKEIGTMYGVTPAGVRHILRQDPTGARRDAWKVKALMEIMGAEAAEKFMEYYGGEQIGYMPGNGKLHAYMRRREIWRAFYDAGKTVGEIVGEFGVAEHTVRTIINRKYEDLRHVNGA